jgi:hypothetical protein
MSSRIAKFTATETVAKPTRVKFKTKSGETVSFKAFKTVERKRTVRFRSKKK